MVRRILLHGLLPALLPGMAALALYAHTTTFGYVRWDDYQLILENPLVRGFSPKIFWSYDPELYIPFTLLTYQIEYALTGGAAWMAHAINVLLHAANATLVWMLVRHLTQRPWIAAGAALLFASHPLAVEAVAWASGRKELLWTLWVLAAALLLLRRRAGQSTCALALAALSKPTAVVAPLLLRLTGVPWKQLWPAGTIAAITLAIAYGGKASTATVLSPVQVAALGLQSIADVLLRFVRPTGLSPLTTAAAPSISAAALPAIVIAALLTVAWKLRLRAPLAWTGMLWFLASLAPSLLTYMRSNEIQLAADRYAYMPLVGAALVAAELLQWGARKAPRATLTIAACIFAALSGLTLMQASLWKDSATLFAAAVERTPRSAVAWNNHGDALLAAGELPRAEAAFARALDLRPDYADALANMGAVRGRQERYDEAESYLLSALSLKPDHVQATFNMAGVLWKRGDVQSALIAYRRVLELKPDFAPALRQVKLLERQ